MNSRFDELNPMNYENNIERFPDTYVDYFDTRKRKVRCISEGTDEVVYLIRNSQNFSTNTHIFIHIVPNIFSPLFLPKLFSHDYHLFDTFLQAGGISQDTHQRCLC
ncbi:hypothetical protein SAMN02910342_02217 [Butyrivibrio sp. INlla21]|nr:hypothetical protein SAMN02910342_02217 [Butyrivibrio sp. INlla21]